MIYNTYNNTKNWDNYSSDSDDYPENSDLGSVVQRIVTYVIPGAIVGGALSAATCGFTAFISVFGTVGGGPQLLRELVKAVADGEVNFKKLWEEASLIDQVTIVALAILTLIGLGFFLALHFKVQPEAYIFMAVIGAMGGALFSSGLSDPPLLDYTDWEIVTY